MKKNLFLSLLMAAVVVFASCEDDKMDGTVPVESVTMSKSTMTLITGEDSLLTVNIVPPDATDPFVVWTSTNNTVATVSMTGLVTAHVPGSTVITAVAGSHYDICLVTVVDHVIPVTDLTLDSTSMHMLVFDTVTLGAAVLPTSATDAGVTWSSTNTAVATVDANGFVTAVGPGAATIKAKAGDITEVCTVTVANPGGDFGAFHWTIDKAGTLTITGSDSIPYDNPWRHYMPQTKNVVIGAGVLGFKDQAFIGYTSMESISVSSTATFFGANAFGDCIALTSVAIPEGTTAIGNQAFRGCVALSGVTLPSTLGVIGAEAFVNCTALTSVSIPANVSEMYGGAFKGCTQLATVSLPATGLDFIGEGTFYDCIALTAIEIPGSVGHIDAQAFMGCVKLTTVTLNSGTASIGNEAFRSCVKLTGITMPGSLTSIGTGAFRGDVALEDVVLANGVAIGEDAFRDCTALAEIEIPGGATIGVAAFRGCLDLADVTLTPGVASMSDSAFTHCVSLTGIVVPASITTIPKAAFMGCVSLSSVDLPVSLTSIGERAFYDCYALNTSISPVFTCRASTPPTLGTDALDYDPDLHYGGVGSHPGYECRLYVPSGSESAYSAWSAWFASPIDTIP